MNAPAPFHAPPAALIIVSGGPAPSEAQQRAVREADPGLHKLLATLPAATRVLEVGGGGSELAALHAQRQPGAHWTHLAVDAPLPAPGTESFDLIVVNRLEHLVDPAATLAALGALLQPGGELRVLAANHASLSGLSRLVEADPSSGVAATAGAALSVGQAHPRWQSHATIFKLMLDAGWTPALLDHVPEARLDDRVAAGTRYMADALGVPAGCADHIHRMAHLVIRGQRQFDDAVPASTTPLFDVLVPTTKEQQLRVNVEQSPGLREVAARIISYRGASSPAEAWDGAQPHVQADWVLLCHQDIYFPKGFGQRLNALLATIPAEERARTLIGFVGLGINRQTEQPEPAGFVIDRIHAADHPASEAAISIDELAIVMSRDSIHRLDPLIGWHLWATDLCLSAVCTHRVFPRIVRLPLYHNTHSGWTLPEAFYDSADYILQKFPDFQTIHSLCGQINTAFVAQHRKARS
jgi:SAM-dependent methyltransferase